MDRRLYEVRIGMYVLDIGFCMKYGKNLIPGSLLVNIYCVGLLVELDNPMDKMFCNYHF